MRKQQRNQKFGIRFIHCCGSFVREVTEICQLFLACTYGKNQFIFGPGESNVKQAHLFSGLLLSTADGNSSFGSGSCLCTYAEGVFFGKIKADSQFFMKEYCRASGLGGKRTRCTGENYNGKFKSFAFMNGHIVYGIVIFVNDRCIGRGRGFKIFIIG